LHIDRQSWDSPEVSADQPMLLVQTHGERRPISSSDLILRCAGSNPTLKCGGWNPAAPQPASPVCNASPSGWHSKSRDMTAFRIQGFSVCGNARRKRDLALCLQGRYFGVSFLRRSSRRPFSCSRITGRARSHRRSRPPPGSRCTPREIQGGPARRQPTRAGRARIRKIRQR
jgi:hypothetical protein